MESILEIEPDTAVDDRIRILKSALNILKGRGTSLESVCSVSAYTGEITPFTEEELRSSQSSGDYVQGLVTKIFAQKKLIEMLHKNITATQFSMIEDEPWKENIRKIIGCISSYSKVFLDLNLSEAKNNLLHLKTAYSTQQNSYRTYLQDLENKNTNDDLNENDKQRLQKVQLKVHKINFMRVIKACLIASTDVYSDKLPQLQVFHSFNNSNLTVDDFKTKWDEGYRD